MSDTLTWDAVLFDFDGTLVDSIPLIVETYQHVFMTHLGHPGDETEIMASIGTPLEAFFHAWPSDLAQAMLDTYMAYNIDHIHTSLGIFLGIPQLLADLRQRGILLGIVTSKRLRSLNKSLDDFELRDYFDLLVTKDDTTRHKPHPEPLLVAMQRLGLSDARRVLYVGDSIHDLQAAINAGCQPVMVGWTRMPRASLHAAHPAIWIEQAADLLQYLK